jgi:hypothetical protein
MATVRYLLLILTAFNNGLFELGVCNLEKDRL